MELRYFKKLVMNIQDDFAFIMVQMNLKPLLGV